MSRRTLNSLARRCSPAVLLVALASGCGAAAGASEDWWYHWSCNGDSECLATQPGAANQASGSLDEGPVEANCTQLLEFARHFWGPAATNSCDHSSAMPPPGLRAIWVTPSNAFLPVGATLQYKATASYSDLSTADVTARATWQSGTGAVATIAAGGLATATATGSTTISATMGVISGSAGLTVGAAALVSIEVTPANPTLAVGDVVSLAATGVYSDGSRQALASPSWSSATPAAVTVAASGAIGGGELATAVAAGSSIVTASFGSVSGSTTVTVTPAVLRSIAVTPASPTLGRGFGLQLRATGTWSDGSTADLTASAAWSSATPSVATVIAGGLATGVAAGTAVVTATSGAVSGGTTVTVTAAALASLAIVPAGASIAPGATQQLTAVATFDDGTTQVLSSGAAWSSGSPGVATVGAGGLASGLVAGVTTITAAAGGKQASTPLYVTFTGIAWSPPGGAGGGGSGTSQNLHGVTWTGAEFVAVGDAGTVLTSPDGNAWTAQSSGSAANLAAVAWSGTQLVAVGAAGAILTSPDGAAWTARSSGVIVDLAAVAWSGTRLVAVGAGGTILTSADGAAWTADSSGVAYALYGVGASGAGLVTAGFIGTILSSPDGIGWTSRGGISLAVLYGVGWGAPGWVAVGGMTNRNIITGVRTTVGIVETSPDGVVWTSRNSGTASFLSSVAWTGSQYVAVGTAGTILGSGDGASWSGRTSGTSADLTSVAWSGSELVAVGSGGAVVRSP